MLMHAFTYIFTSSITLAVLNQGGSTKSAKAPRIQDKFYLKPTFLPTFSSKIADTCMCENFFCRCNTFSVVLPQYMCDKNQSNFVPNPGLEINFHSLSRIESADFLQASDFTERVRQLGSRMLSICILFKFIHAS